MGSAIVALLDRYAVPVLAAVLLGAGTWYVLYGLVDKGIEEGR